MSKVKHTKPNYIWKDRKRILGLPITFIRYRMSEDRLFFETGFFNTRGEEILLYRIRDISVSISFWQRLTGVGTVTVSATDKSAPSLAMRNIKRPRDVKEMLHAQVEKAKIAYRVRYTEMMGELGPGMGGPGGGMVDLDGDGIPDMLEQE
ncbi:MAG: PH domain-containing protein [Clostridia bacterium]|nr:PH domain-containing protein [Clostridia bacterium]